VSTAKYIPALDKYLVWQSGAPKLATREELLACCCGCECPCASWPPESWPCGGLNQTYAVTNGYASPVDAAAIILHQDMYGNPDCSGDVMAWQEWRLSSSQTVTAGDTPCGWAGTTAGNWEARSNTSPTWTAIANIEISLYLDACVWKVVASVTMVKNTGQTPVGAYANQGIGECGSGVRQWAGVGVS